MIDILFKEHKSAKEVLEEEQDNKKLLEKYVALSMRLQEENLKEGFGFTNVTVNITKSSDVPYVTYEAAADSVATDKLYEIAAQIVKLLAG